MSCVCLKEDGGCVVRKERVSDILVGIPRQKLLEGNVMVDMVQLME
jgi:hypothetical protein